MADYRNGPLPAAVVGRTALDMLRRTWPRAWPVWAVAALVNAVAQAIVLSAPEPPGGAASPSLSAPELIGAALNAALMAAGLRRLLESPRTWEPDRGALTYLGVDLAFSGVMVAWVWAVWQIAGQGKAAALPPSAGGMAIGLIVVGALLLWSRFRIALWPLAKLMGHQGLTLPDAWRRMKGAFGGWLAAQVVLCWIPNYLVAVIFLGAVLKLHDASPAALAGDALFGVAVTGLQAMSTALMAAVYHLRAGGKPPGG